MSIKLSKHSQLQCFRTKQKCKRKNLESLVEKRTHRYVTQKKPKHIDITKTLLYYAPVTCNFTATDERRTPMQTEKKTFTKAEVEVVHFEKTDVIATSTVIIGPITADGGTETEIPDP